MTLTYRSFDQRASSTILVIFYSGILLITGFLYYLEKINDPKSHIFPIDNIAEYLQ